MAQPRQAPAGSKGRRRARRWTLGGTAPGWFRRVWGERAREVPKPSQPAGERKKASKVNMDRIRRITYL